jgi:hypothetical protein
MTDEQLAAMHKLLAEYHRKVATESLLDVVQQYHADLAQRLADEAALIPRRTAIVERLHEREQKKWKMATSTNDVSPLGCPEVLFQGQFTDKLHDAIFDDIGFNSDP